MGIWGCGGVKAGTQPKWVGVEFGSYFSPGVRFCQSILWTLCSFGQTGPHVSSFAADLFNLWFPTHFPFDVALSGFFARHLPHFFLDLAQVFGAHLQQDASGQFQAGWTVFVAGVCAAQGEGPRL